MGGCGGGGQLAYELFYIFLGTCTGGSSSKVGRIDYIL